MIISLNVPLQPTIFPLRLEGQLRQGVAPIALFERRESLPPASGTSPLWVAENWAIYMRSAAPSHINSRDPGTRSARIIARPIISLCPPDTWFTSIPQRQAERRNYTRRLLYIVASPHNIEANAFQLPSLDFEEQQKSFLIGLSFEGESDF